MFEKESKEYANKWLEHVKDLELQHKSDDKPEYIRILEAHHKGMEKILRSPTFETKINKAVFLNQEIVVFPHEKELPGNFVKVIKFLFGEGAVATLDCVNNYGCIRITGANYVLDNVKTLNADWEYKEVKNV